MPVTYIFIDGRTQQCSLPADFPLYLVETLLDNGNNEHGLIAIEVNGDLHHV